MTKIDPSKRRRVMQRSQLLGHCICDPRKPCPCDVFTQQGICPCAGERPEPASISNVRLTELVHNAGCSSKIAPTDLEAVLSRLPAVNDPAVLSGIACSDDAGVYRLPDGTLLVQTVDVMTPCCDDPYTFGRICAANCLSDIYAMGGRPCTALSILAFPSETLDGQVMYQMLRGAMEVLASAGVALIGGHSIKDAEIKLGFAITGTIQPGQLTAHDTARVGDIMVLTKPLGVGVMTFAHQIGRSYGQFATVIDSMAQLNDQAASAAAQADVSACTDVTGFGLYGHLISMARHSKVTAEVWADALPAFAGALQAIGEGVVPGAIERNQEYVADDIQHDPQVDQARYLLGFDAQTSGGLLICVAPTGQAALLAALKDRGLQAWTIGRILEPSSGRIIVTNKSAKDAGASKPCCCSAEESNQDNSDKPRATASQAQCCSGQGNSCCGDDSASQAGPAKQAFGAFLKACAAGGAIDARTKELITFALVVAGRCGPCVAMHRSKALSMGITQAQLDEAAWCAVAMGGAPVRAFYLEQSQAD
jgi:selenide,water dikinase